MNRFWLNDSQNNNWQIKSFAYKLKQIVSLLTGINVQDLEKEEVKQMKLTDWTVWKLDWLDSYDHGTQLFADEDSAIKEKKEMMATGNYYSLSVERTIPTVRFTLQFLGTDLLRNQLHPDVWVNSLFLDYKPLFSIKHKLAGEEVDENYEPQQDDIVEQYPNWLISDLRFPNEHKAIHDRDGICIRVERNTLAKDLHQSETALDGYNFDWLIDNTKDIPWLVNEVKLMLKYYKIPYNE